MGHQLFIDFPLPTETCWQEEKSCRSQNSLAAFFGPGPPSPSSNEKRRRCYYSHGQHPGAWFALVKLSSYSACASSNLCSLA